MKAKSTDPKWLNQDLPDFFERFMFGNEDGDEVYQKVLSLCRKRMKMSKPMDIDSSGKNFKEELSIKDIISKMKQAQTGKIMPKSQPKKRLKKIANLMAKRKASKPVTPLTPSSSSESKEEEDEKSESDDETSETGHN